MEGVYIGKGWGGSLTQQPMWDRKNEKQVWEARKHAYGRVLARKLTRAEEGWLEEELGGSCLHNRLAEQHNQPAVPRQPPLGLAEARWVLADFGGLFGLVRGPIFNPKEVGTQVRHTMNQTKEIWDKTGLRFDQSEFSKFDSWK